MPYNPTREKNDSVPMPSLVSLLCCVALVASSVFVSAAHDEQAVLAAKQQGSSAPVSPSGGGSVNTNVGGSQTISTTGDVPAGTSIGFGGSGTGPTSTSSSSTTTTKISSKTNGSQPSSVSLIAATVVAVATVLAAFRA